MKTNKLKVFGVLAVLLIGLLAISGIAKADSVPVTIEKVFINGEELDSSTEVVGDIVRGDSIEVKVKLSANETDEDIVVEATVEGLDHDSEKASDKTSTFKVKEGKTYYKTLNLELPDRIDIDNEDDREYRLRIEISNRRDDEVKYDVILYVDSERHKISIKDVIMSPENEVKAGRALLTTVRVKNMGEDDEEDVKVKVSIPELGISASDYLDEVEEDDTKSSEELYMRIPECAEAGQYTLKVTVEFDDGDESVSENHVVTVVESETCGAGADQTVVAVSAETQTITAGANGAVYPLTISNTGSSAKTYTISATAGNALDIKISPNVAVLSAGETKVVYVYVSANEDATAGEESFTLAIKSGDETLKEVTLKANVEEAKGSAMDKVKKGLEVALVVLVVFLVIIGLIIGFNKLKGDEDDEIKEETYY